MKKVGFLLLLSFLIFGCAKSKRLDDARMKLAEAKESPAVKENAQVKLDDAQSAYNKAKSSVHPDDIYIAKRRAEIALVYAQATKAEEEYLAAKSIYDDCIAKAKNAKDDEIAKLKAELEEKDKLLKKKEDEWKKAQAELMEAIKGMGEVKEEARGLVLYISDILFDFNKSTLRSASVEGLSKIAKALEKHPTYKIKVEGHTDWVGSDAYNMKLSDARAKTVAIFLVSNGIAKGRVSEIGLGESKPIADNKTAEGRQRNRRVEIVVSQQKKGTK